MGNPASSRMLSQRQSALGCRQEVEQASVPVLITSGLSVLELPFVSKWLLQFKPWLGVGAPPLPAVGQTRVTDYLVTLGLSPVDWLSYGQRTPTEIASEALVVTDVSCRFGLLEVSGRRAADLLATSCGLDFHGDELAAGRCAQTRFGHFPVMLHRLALPPGSAPVYHLLIDRSLLRAACDWIRRCAGSK